MIHLNIPNNLTFLPLLSMVSTDLSWPGGTNFSSFDTGVLAASLATDWFMPIITSTVIFFWLIVINGSIMRDLSDSDSWVSAKQFWTKTDGSCISLKDIYSKSNTLTDIVSKYWVATSLLFYTNKQTKKQEAHGPQSAHPSDIATADMQMFPIIYAKIQP